MKNSNLTINGVTSKNVLFVSSSYPQNSKDWKSVFVRQMLKALSDNNQVRFSYWGPPGTIPANVKSICLAQETRWLDQLMDRGGIIHLLRKGGVSRYTTPLQFLYFLRRACKRTEDVDLYHVNWLQNAIPLIGTRKPLVISVLGSDFGLLKMPGLVMFLRMIFKRCPCVLAPNAEWMVDCLNIKFGDICRVTCIPLGIGDEWYRTQRVWQPESTTNWLVVSRLTKAKIGNLFDWGKDVFSSGSRHELHLFGPMQEDLEIPDWVNYHGSTYPDELRENWFPKAAGLITLSQHDEGRPQVMLEAMASGVPIIASKIAAHENFIGHKSTGFIVSSSEEFFAGIEWLSSGSNNKCISETARAWVTSEIGTWADCAQRYVDVYSSLLEV